MRNFTPEDFSGAGQYLVRVTNEELYAREQNKPFNGVTRTGFLSTIMYKVGYIRNNWKIGGSNGRITTLAAMSDGCTQHGHFITEDEKGNKLEIKDWLKVLWVTDDNSSGKEKLCNHLNDPDTQEMRFATQEEVVRVVLYQKARWRN